jgi:hypothetical protein
MTDTLFLGQELRSYLGMRKKALVTLSVWSSSIPVCGGGPVPPDPAS